MRVLLAVVTMVLTLAVPGQAQDKPQPWRQVITEQIEAFRSEDRAGALRLAGQGFRTQFAGRPEAFYDAIMSAGYRPIAESRTHSFGESDRVSETIVLQVVKLVGYDQGLYGAIYQMADEPGEGWRVVGVVLRREAGVGI